MKIDRACENCKFITLAKDYDNKYVCDLWGFQVYNPESVVCKCHEFNSN